MTLLPKLYQATILVSIYKGERFLEVFMRYLISLNDFAFYEIILLHNDPLESELNIIEPYLAAHDNIRHQKIPLEPLYCTWNRGISLASAQYITVWNIDDIRLPESVRWQLDCLRSNGGVGIAFGDIWGTRTHDAKKDEFYWHPDFKSKKGQYFRRHMIGCFQMWRKSIHNDVGYYDEQFKLVGDFDFQIRTASKFEICKTEQPLGYYLIDDGQKLSSNRKVQAVERNVLYLRYGMFDRIDFMYLPDVILKYHVFKVKKDQQFSPVSNSFNRYWWFWAKRTPLMVVGLILFPRNFLRYFYHLYKSRS